MTSTAEPRGSVQLVAWPTDESLRERLRAERRPRLLLVEGDIDPPVVDDLEDWIRVPAPDVDVRARVDALDRRRRGRGEQPAVIGDDGVLRRGAAWVTVPPVEARLARALLARRGAVVSRESLSRAAWPHDIKCRNALDVHVRRLRMRVAAVDLTIETVRRRGYLIETSDSSQELARNA